MQYHATSTTAPHLLLLLHPIALQPTPQLNHLSLSSSSTLLQARRCRLQLLALPLHCLERQGTSGIGALLGGSKLDVAHARSECEGTKGFAGVVNRGGGCGRGGRGEGGGMLNNGEG